MIANAKYDANNIHKSLSITPINDIKDMLGLLEKSDTYGLENTYEDVESKNDLNDLFESYVESLNRFPEEIELLVIYYSGKDLYQVQETWKFFVLTYVQSPV